MRIQDLIKKRMTEREAFMDSLKSSKDINLIDHLTNNSRTNSQYDNQQSGDSMSNTNLPGLSNNEHSSPAK